MSCEQMGSCSTNIKHWESHRSGCHIVWKTLQSVTTQGIRIKRPGFQPSETTGKSAPSLTYALKK